MQRPEIKTMQNLEAAFAGESMAHIKYRYFAKLCRAVLSSSPKDCVKPLGGCPAYRRLCVKILRRSNGDSRLFLRLHQRLVDWPRLPKKPVNHFWCK